MAKQNSLWPDVSDLPGAERAIRYGFWAAVFVAGATAAVALLAAYLHRPVLGMDGSALLDAALFAGLGLGIAKKSRAAAVAGLGLYFVERVYSLRSGATNTTGLFMTVILTLYFMHGIRGTFAYRKLRNSTAARPVTKTSEQALQQQ